MNEFKLELGSMKRALWSAVLAVVQFIVVPLILTILISSVLNGFSSPSVKHLGHLIGDYSFYIIVLGAILAVLAALKGYYPKGSISRLTFDLALVPFYLLLVWSFDMGGSMGPAFNDAGFPFQLDLVLWLITLFIVFKSLYKLAEFMDFRRSFLESLARTYPEVKAPLPRPAEDPSDHRPCQDFLPRYGRFLSGMAEADRALLWYVIFPLLIVILLGGVIQSTQGLLQSMTGTAGANASGLFGLGSATLDRLSTLLLFIGLPIAVMSFFKGFYPKGSVSRLTFALIVVALICVWIYVAALGGHISVSMNVSGSDIHFDLNYEILLWIFIFAAALWGIYWAVEAYIYRKDWKQNGFVPVDDAVLRQQRRQRRAEERERMREGQK
jgi:ABC-type multidrug transport system fused ATPase/permease subunit